MGRNPIKVNKKFVGSDGKKVNMELNLFGWEKLDYVDKIKKLFKFAK